MVRLFLNTLRHFGAKPAKPAGKGGPPGAAPVALPKKREPTPMQKYIASGQEFIFGPPPGANKQQNVMRDQIQYRLAPRIEVYARKLREIYFREGTIPTQKTYFEAIRERQPEDTLHKCMEERVIPCVINRREEFDDVDLIMKWRTPFHVTRDEHGMVRPWYIRHPVTEEEIRVTVNSIDYHNSTRLPYFMDF